MISDDLGHLIHAPQINPESQNRPDFQQFSSKIRFEQVQDEFGQNNAWKSQFIQQFGHKVHCTHHKHFRNQKYSGMDDQNSIVNKNH